MGANTSLVTVKPCRDADKRLTQRRRTEAENLNIRVAIADAGRSRVGGMIVCLAPGLGFVSHLVVSDADTIEAVMASKIAEQSGSAWPKQVSGGPQ